MNKKKFKELCHKTDIDLDKIPKQTPYCYSIDKQRIKDNKNPFAEDGSLPIITCPYFVWGKSEFRGCLYEKIYTDDPVFGDQVKICNIR